VNTVTCARGGTRQTGLIVSGGAPQAVALLPALARPLRRGQWRGEPRTSSPCSCKLAIMFRNRFFMPLVWLNGDGCSAEGWGTSLWTDTAQPVNKGADQCAAGCAHLDEDRDATLRWWRWHGRDEVRGRGRCAGDTNTPAAKLQFNCARPSGGQSASGEQDCWRSAALFDTRARARRRAHSAPPCTQH